MKNMTREELKDWENDFVRILLPKGRNQEIDGVSFSVFVLSIEFRYGNAVGLIHCDNGYNGEQPDGRNYYPLLKLSCRYSDEVKYNPSFGPSLAAAASAIKQSWKDFTK